MATGAVVVRAQGLSRLRRDLRRIDSELGREADRHIRAVAAAARGVARERAPYLTGELARSIRYSLRSRGATLYSNLEQAPVLHWGGTIEPRGVPITFESRPFLAETVEEEARNIDEELGRLLDVIADRYGFTG